jgi:hypothetical protein
MSLSSVTMISPDVPHYTTDTFPVQVVIVFKTGAQNIQSIQLTPTSNPSGLNVFGTITIINQTLEDKTLTVNATYTQSNAKEDSYYLYIKITGTFATYTYGSNTLILYDPPKLSLSPTSGNVPGTVVTITATASSSIDFNLTRITALYYVDPVTQAINDIFSQLATAPSSSTTWAFIAIAFDPPEVTTPAVVATVNGVNLLAGLFEILGMKDYMFTLDPVAGLEGSQVTITNSGAGADTLDLLTINNLQLAIFNPNLNDFSLVSVTTINFQSSTEIIFTVPTIPAIAGLTYPYSSYVIMNSTTPTPGVYYNAGLYEIVFNYPTVICFKENTKILCLKEDKEIDINVQDLKSGDLVKTLKNGYLPINVVGKDICYNPKNLNRIKNRLYKLSKNKYPELKEDIVLTGCHSILVDNISEDKYSEIIKNMGQIYITDDKYRLPTFLDERSEIYTDEYGDIAVYHIALGNDERRNYGIYANGLLVETCFISRIKNQMIVIS